MRLRAVTALVIFALTAYGQNQPELRGVWVTPHESGGIAFWTRAQIAAAMDSIAAANFNTVFFDAWSGGFPLWRSEVFHDETGYYTDPLLGSRDLLQEAITEAHRAGLEIQAWMEYGFIAWWDNYIPAGAPANGPLLNAHPDWSGSDSTGHYFLHTSEGGNYYWLNQNHPDVQAFMISLCQELATRYDLDGVQLDRIQYPQLNWGYDSASVAIYESEHSGMPPPQDAADSSWMRWRADNLSQFQRGVFDSIKVSNPYLLVSTTPSHYATGSSYPAYESYLQDWKAWVNNGWTDNVQVQMFVNATQLPLYVSSALDGIQDEGKVAIGIAAVTSGTIRNANEMLSMISEARSRGLLGETFWYYNDLRDLGYLSVIKQNAYQTRVFPPYRASEWRNGGLIFSDSSSTIRGGHWTRQPFGPAIGGFFFYADTLQPDSIVFQGEVPSTAWYELYVYLVGGSTAFTTHAAYQIYSDDVPVDTIVISQVTFSNSGWRKLADIHVQSGGIRTIYKLTNKDIGYGQFVYADDMMLILNRKLSPDVPTGISGRSLPDGPHSFSLQQNYPNPFNAETVIRYTIGQGGHVRLTVYDLLGREVATLVDGVLGAGEYRVRFDASSLPSGVYLARLEAGPRTETRKMLLLK